MKVTTHLRPLLGLAFGLLFGAGLAFAPPIVRAEDGEDAELVETRTEVPRLKAAAPYEMKGGVVEIELSQYAGYAGLVAANGGLEPSEQSIFFKKHGFKVKLALSEEESWSSLNSGRMAASATTVDVLAVYGRQFQVVVPALIGFSRGADGIVVRSDVKRINDLKGKVLATGQFTEADFFMRYLAQEASLGVNMLPDLAARPDPTKVNLVFCADGFAAGDLFLKDVKAGRNRLAGCITWAPKTTEVAEASGGKAYVLTTNRNLLIVADVLIVNKGFAEAHGDVVAGLVDGLLAGNAMVRTDPSPHLAVIGKAFGWSAEEARAELAKVHLANLPESQAFFAGTIDAAGSYGGIFESAVQAYGKDLIPSPAPPERFLAPKALEAAAASGAYKDQKPLLVPLASRGGPAVEGDPLLSKDIRFHFQPNSHVLDMSDAENTARLASIKKLLQVSPGSMVLLRGHVDNGMVEEFRRQGGEALVRKQGLAAMQLSKDRAGEIARLLTEKFGVDRARVEPVGRGWDEPLGTDQAANRRVEVQWFTLE
jgi:NitT/TauT family transport system substrate-binding protein